MPHHRFEHLLDACFAVQGFHRIESILFRDGTTDTAAKYSTDLVRLWGLLEEALADPSKFEFCSWFDGVQGLATEIAAKKMSSEEETFSDESTLIFANNFIGIREAATPFAKVASNATAVERLMKALNESDHSVAPFVFSGVLFKSHYTDKIHEYAVCNALITR